MTVSSLEYPISYTRQLYFTWVGTAQGHEYQDIILKDHNQVAPVVPVEVNLHQPVDSLTPGMGASHGSSAELSSHPCPQPIPDV